MPPSREDLLKAFKTKLSGISGAYVGWDGIHNVGKFDQELIEASPADLRIIATACVGYDNFDHEKMRSLRNIALTNVPSNVSSSDEVADLALYLTLCAFRRFPVFEKALQTHKTTFLARGQLHTHGFDHESGRGGSEPLDGFPFGHVAGGKPVNSPKGKTALIVGFGSIGQAVGSRLNALGMKVHYTKRTPLAKSQVPLYGPTYHESLESALPIADLVVLCVPGSPENANMINERTIGMLPSIGLRIVNVGRGSLVDPEALLKGLKSGRILSFASDVFAKEPFVNKEILAREDTYLLPHIGSSTVEVFDNSTSLALEEVCAVLKGNAPRFVVN